MSEGLLIVERMVLESLVKKPKNMVELALDTGLEEGLLKNIIPFFMMENILRYERGIYSINSTESSKWADKINKSDYLKEEVKERILILLYD